MPLATLPPRNRDIVARSARGETVRSIAKVHNISPTRVSQILDRAEPAVFIDGHRASSRDMLERHRRMVVAVKSIQKELDDIAAIILKTTGVGPLD